tara:strand:+ start:274 stop:1206 length:933 start_codon:yes stop_codon:yes gene_type:complete
MAVRQIAVTDTIEKFRTEFNAMTLNDFGDIADLDASLSATTIVGALNETLSVATDTSGFKVEDSSSTQQLIGGGEILRVLGTTNQTTAVVSATDTLTIGLPNSVTITTQLTSPTVVAGNLTLTNGSITDSSGAISFGNENISTTGTLGSGAITSSGNISGVNITGTGSTHTLGTIEVAGNVIRSTDSTQIEVNDSLKVVGPLAAGVTTLNPAGSNNIESTTGFTLFGSSIVLGQGQSLAFEGATANDFETDIQVTDPTADRTITFPDASGTVALTGSTGYATSTIFTSAVTLILYNSSGTPVKTIVGSAT